MQAGPRELQVTFVRRTGAYPETLRQPYRRPYTSITGGDTRVQRVQPYLGSVTVTGPFAAAGGPPAHETPSRRRIFACRPASAAPPAPAACARRILSRLARRAYRRPVTAADLDVLLGFFDAGRREGGFDAGIEMALRWLLASPDYCARRPYTSITGGDTRVQPYLGSVTVTGPFAAAGGPPAHETPSRRRIFACRPASAAPPAPAACARRILSRLARRAYRRPVTAADLDVLLGFFDAGRREGGFDAGIEMALRWLLASPDYQCAVTRHHSSAGANPARQLSLQPVAVGADDGGNDIG